MLVIMVGKLTNPSLGLNSQVDLSDGTCVAKHGTTDPKFTGWYIYLGLGMYLHHDGSRHKSLAANTSNWPTREKAVSFYSGWVEMKRVKERIAVLRIEHARIYDMQQATMIPEPEPTKCLNTDCDHHALGTYDKTDCCVFSESDMLKLCKLYFNK